MPIRKCLIFKQSKLACSLRGAVNCHKVTQIAAPCKNRAGRPACCKNTTAYRARIVPFAPGASAVLRKCNTSPSSCCKNTTCCENATLPAGRPAAQPRHRAARPHHWCAIGLSEPSRRCGHPAAPWLSGRAAVRCGSRLSSGRWDREDRKRDPSAQLPPNGNLSPPSAIQ
jgi:hypothetical protein